MLFDGDIKVGQIWRFCEDAESVFKIVKIEEYENANIYHISVINNGRLIEHMPVSKSALISSMVARANVDYDFGSIEDGYKIWKQAFEEGKAGVYSVSVREIVEE
jgi:hypothetical protein